MKSSTSPPSPTYGSVRYLSVRYKDSTASWVITDPHDRLYSSALMSAQEVFTVNGWEPIEGPMKSILSAHFR